MANLDTVEITGEHDLLPPGAPPGTIPTDLEQATGLERLEILGKMQGVDIFDMRPLDATRRGMCAPATPSIECRCINKPYRHPQRTYRRQVVRGRAIRRLHRLTRRLTRNYLAYYLARPAH